MIDEENINLPETDSMKYFVLLKNIFPFFIFLCLFNNLAVGQSKLKVNALNRYEINRQDTLYRFYSIVAPEHFKYQNDKSYYCFADDTIITTQGGASGRLMHGSFTVYYPNKNLESRGEFKYGLKAGEWKQWNTEGKLIQLVTWKNGLLQGSYEAYNKQGDKIKDGYYKDGLFTGYEMQTGPDGKLKKVYYKKGKIKEDKNEKIVTNDTNR
jgi:antitoxin component YwqK of YwqJK toxin-antitoxin module